jgi:hypothetical protein
MPNRRQFLQAAVAVSTVPLAAPMVLASNAGEDLLRLGMAVVEKRFAAACAFAAEASGQGVPVRMVDGDVTALWYDELHARWRTEPAAIAGLTTRPALLCLERLAWDHGMRVVYHARHGLRSDGSFSHQVLMPAGRVRSTKLEALGDHWAKHLARALTRLNPESARARGPSEAWCLPAVSPSEDVTLFSWVIAPINRRV